MNEKRSEAVGRLVSVLKAELMWQVKGVPIVPPEVTDALGGAVFVDFIPVDSDE